MGFCVIGYSNGYTMPSPVGEGVSQRLTDEVFRSGFQLGVKCCFCFSYSSSTADAVPLLPQEKAGKSARVPLTFYELMQPQVAIHGAIVRL